MRRAVLRLRRVQLGRNVQIGRRTVLGALPERASRDPDWRRSRTKIGPRSQVYNLVIVGAGTIIGSDVVIDDLSRIGYDCAIGHRSRVMHGAFICDRVHIGDEARVAGFVCDRAVVGDGATSMGMLVHKYSDPAGDWWGPDEEAPVIEGGAVVGMGAVVVGGVRVGQDSYVAAGAIVSRDVPPSSVAYGINQIVPRQEWNGRTLSTEDNSATP